MKVFVTGATGVLGRRAIPLLVEAGHDVTAVARTPDKAETVRSQGARPASVDLFDADAVRAAVTGHRGVLNLATHIPPMRESMRASAWAENDRLRSEASVGLVDGARAAGAEVFIQESITFTYPDRGAAWIDETVEVEPPSVLLAAPAAERQAARFADEGAGRGVVLRFGAFYAADAGHTVDMVDVSRKGLAPLLGPKQAYQSMVHVDDAALAVVHALALPSGTYNVVDDEPLPKQELAAVMAEAVGRKGLRWTIASLSRLGGRKTEALRRSQRVSNGALRATGWSPSIPSFRVGWPATVAEIDATAGRAAPRTTLDKDTDKDAEEDHDRGDHRDAA